MRLIARAGSLSVSTVGGLGGGWGSRLSARSYGPEVPGLGSRGLGFCSALQVNPAGQVGCRLGGLGVGWPALSLSKEDLMLENLKRGGGLKSGGEATRVETPLKVTAALGVQKRPRDLGRRRPA